MPRGWRWVNLVVKKLARQFYIKCIKDFILESVSNFPLSLYIPTYINYEKPFFLYNFYSKPRKLFYPAPNGTLKLLFMVCCGTGKSGQGNDFEKRKWVFINYLTQINKYYEIASSFPA